MYTPILTTKLYIPPLRPRVVPRPHLTERLNDDLHRKLTLIAAPTGFGKTTLVSTWAASCDQQVAWLSLDARENDPTRFLTYFAAALQTVAPGLGKTVVGALQSPASASLPTESILMALINEITTIPNNFILVLDDYHAVDADTINQALAFLIEHMPPQMRLVIATREDPQLPLARLRAGDELTELRVSDLRFTPSE